MEPPPPISPNEMPINNAAINPTISIRLNLLSPESSVNLRQDY